MKNTAIACSRIVAFPSPLLAPVTNPVRRNGRLPANVRLLRKVRERRAWEFQQCEQLRMRLSDALREVGVIDRAIGYLTDQRETLLAQIRCLESQLADTSSTNS